jgi:ribonuclease BN (tRNA processing enzyme)
MKMEVLGCSGGIGGERRTSAFLIDHDVLIDAGSGVGELSLQRMAQIDHVFLTHAHLDHIMMLPLLADAVLFMRDRPLQVYALAETCATLRQCVFNGKLWPDYTALPNAERPYVRLHDIAIGQTMALGERSITALPAKHSIPAAGYCVQAGRGCIAFSGDTTWCEEFYNTLNILNNLKYLIIESTFLSANAAAAEKSGHMTPALLAHALQQLPHGTRVLINHMESGREEETWQEIIGHCGKYHPQLLQRGEILEI